MSSLLAWRIILDNASTYLSGCLKPKSSLRAVSNTAKQSPNKFAQANLFG
ncbi:MAG: hypothetical protein IIU35_06260 [Neisseriaceae bacterium]|nr:hypothetical protein [Neisseriaceae bacterium]